MSILGVQARGDGEAVLIPRRGGEGTSKPGEGEVEPWEDFVHALQCISNRPVALRIREWLPTGPLWEIITPDVEFANAVRFYTLPSNRGIGTTPRTAVLDYMEFAAEAFDRRNVVAVFCRDAPNAKDKWAFYTWRDNARCFVPGERPAQDPEPTAPALL